MLLYRRRDEHSLDDRLQRREMIGEDGENSRSFELRRTEVEDQMAPCTAEYLVRNMLGCSSATEQIKFPIPGQCLGVVFLFVLQPRCIRLLSRYLPFGHLKDAGLLGADLWLFMNDMNIRHGRVGSPWIPDGQFPLGAQPSRSHFTAKPYFELYFLYT